MAENQTNKSGDKVMTLLKKIDNTKWNYNIEDNVYWQVQVSYCANPADSQYETLGIFVPAQFMTAVENGDGTFTCSVNPDGEVAGYTAVTAPIVIPVETPGYSAMAAPKGYISRAADYTKAGFVYVNAGCRGRDSGAPAGVTDLKAAVRYIRYCSEEFPGNTERIFTFGMSGGGAQSALMGATGNSELYIPYLEKIGAVTGVSDTVAGSMCWCPITNLDYADEAYEWNMGITRLNLDDDTRLLSDKMATAYAKYINELGLTDENGNELTLEQSEHGIYQAGSYYEYIKGVIEHSLNNFLSDTIFPYFKGDFENSANHMDMEGNANKGRIYQTAQEYIDDLNADGEWIFYNRLSNSVTINSVEDFAKKCKVASKKVGAFDDLNAMQIENVLFGYADGKGAHFDTCLAELLKDTDYEMSFAYDMERKDTEGNSVNMRVNMYNPLFFLCEYYDGYNHANVAKYWRIRAGISQGDTALTTEVNLALALKSRKGTCVDFETVWEQKHILAERTGDSTHNFISWVNKCVREG